MDAKCIGCGDVGTTATSPYFICAECNPARYEMSEDRTDVTASPGGRYKMALPRPEVREPSALLIDVRNGVAIPQAAEGQPWWFRPFRRYSCEVVHRKDKDGRVVRVVTVQEPNVFLRALLALAWVFFFVTGRRRKWKTS